MIHLQVLNMTEWVVLVDTKQNQIFFMIDSENCVLIREPENNMKDFWES